MHDTEPGHDGRPRLQRPAAGRQAPLRRPPLGLPASVNAALQQGLDSSRALAGDAEAGLQGFVERGVATAYTVIDAYLRRGRQAAQRVSPGAPEGAAPLSGLSGLGGLGGLGATLAAASPWGATASSLAGPWLQLLRAWADAVATLGPQAGRTGPGDALPPGFFAAGGATAMPEAAAAAASTPPPAAAAAAGPRAKVTVELLSQRGAEMAVSLEPGADLAALQADWLMPPCSPAAAAPGSLTLYSEPGHVHLRLALADPPRAGRHEARITDPQGQAWGSVVITVAPPAAA